MNDAPLNETITFDTERDHENQVQAAPKSKYAEHLDVADMSMNDIFELSGADLRCAYHGLPANHQAIPIPRERKLLQAIVEVR